MKKFLPYILIFGMIASFIAPFSSVQAGDYTKYEQAFTPGSSVKCTGSKGDPKEDITGYTDSDKMEVYFDVVIDTGKTMKEEVDAIWYLTALRNSDNTTGSSAAFVLKIEDTDNNITGGIPIRKYIVNEEKKKIQVENRDLPDKASFGVPSKEKDYPITKYETTDGMENFLPETNYEVTLYYRSVTDGKGGGEAFPVFDEKALSKKYRNPEHYYKISDTFAFRTSSITGKKGNTNISKSTATSSYDPVDYKCGVNNIAGCFARLFYNVFFKVTSYLFAASGMFFDATFAYSIDSSSYEMTFITEGWSLVRDFVNLFFIFILLYAALSIILDLKRVNGKQVVINVVIIGLLINFSLFATQIIVDTSNILAKVFYNQITIEDATGGSSQKSRGGLSSGYSSDQKEIKSLSGALVSKIDPTLLILKAEDIELNRIDTDTQINEETGVGVGTFILVVLLAIAINVIGIITFLTVGIIFIARIVGLALAMILAPIAFFSYTIPKMRKFPTIGIDNWFPETVKLAFLAPIFIFFLYLIVQFVQTGLGLVDATEKEGVQLILAIVIPFAFIMILLKRSASIAKDMSGKIGAAALKTTKMVGGAVAGVAGGVAGGIALGGVAKLARGTVGRLGSATANSTGLKKAEKEGNFGARIGAKMLRNLGSAAGKSNFDLRSAKVGGKGIANIPGVKGLGKARKGGFEQIKEEKIEKRTRKAKELETSESSEEKREVSKIESALRVEKAEKATKLTTIDREVNTLRQKMTDQKTAGKPQREIDDTYNELVIKQKASKRLKGYGSLGTIRKGSIADLEKQLNEKTNIMNKKEIDAINKYAARIESGGNKFINYFSSLGQHSGKGANIAADRIRRGVKIEN
ncbi:MAG: hypothetical protein U9R00_03645 [Patescibacteria group bacterium]|nr:hypothetical protein [Patescibacteria group bacterium]